MDERDIAIERYWGLTYAFVVFLELLEGGKLGRPAVVLALYEYA